MPIDMESYTKQIRAALKKGGYACVYVVAAGEGRPSRVSYAEDPVEAVKRLVRSSPLPIAVEGIVWVPDRGIATVISQAVAASIAPYRKAGGWYDLAADSITDAVDIEAFRLYPGAKMIPHDELIRQWGNR